MFSYDLLANAVVAGILLGGFYAAVSLEISVTFGLLDVVSIAHPVSIVLGPHAAYGKEAAPFAWRKGIVRPVPVHAHDAFLRKEARALTMPLEIVHAIITHTRQSGMPPKSVEGIILHSIDYGDWVVLPQTVGKTLLLQHRSPCPGARPGWCRPRSGPAPAIVGAHGRCAPTRRT